MTGCEPQPGPGWLSEGIISSVPSVFEGRLSVQSTDTRALYPHGPLRPTAALSRSGHAVTGSKIVHSGQVSAPA